MRSLIDPTGFYPPGFAGWLPGEKAEASYADCDAHCNDCDTPFYAYDGYHEGDKSICSDCWDDEIDAAQGGDK